MPTLGKQPPTFPRDSTEGFETDRHRESTPRKRLFPFVNVY